MEKVKSAELDGMESRSLLPDIRGGSNMATKERLVGCVVLMVGRLMGESLRRAR